MDEAVGEADDRDDDEREDTDDDSNEDARDEDAVDEYCVIDVEDVSEKMDDTDGVVDEDNGINPKDEEEPEVEREV